MHRVPTHCGDVLVLVGAIVLGGFLSEDGATITAVTLTLSSALDPRIAFFSAFLGLWIGDLGVYMLARTIGPSIMKSPWFQKWFAGSSRRDATQAQNDGGLGLAVSRFFPGTRVAAYVSAALAHMPARVFAGITAVSAFVWVVLVFAAVHFAPDRVAAAHLRLPVVGSLGLAFFLVLHLWRKWCVCQWLRFSFGLVCHEVKVCAAVLLAWPVRIRRQVFKTEDTLPRSRSVRRTTPALTV